MSIMVHPRPARPRTAMPSLLCAVTPAPGYVRGTLSKLLA